MTHQPRRHSRSLVWFGEDADGRTDVRISKTDDHLCRPWPGGSKTCMVNVTSYSRKRFFMIKNNLLNNLIEFWISSDVKLRHSYSLPKIISYKTWVIQWSTRPSTNQSTSMKSGLTLWSVCFVLYGRSDTITRNNESLFKLVLWLVLGRGSISKFHTVSIKNKSQNFSDRSSAKFLTIFLLSTIKCWISIFGFWTVCNRKKFYGIYVVHQTNNACSC